MNEPTLSSYHVATVQHQGLFTRRDKLLLNIVFTLNTSSVECTENVTIRCKGLHLQKQGIDNQSKWRSCRSHSPTVDAGAAIICQCERGFAALCECCYLISHLHIRTSGEVNTKANDKRTNHIFASSFVVLALKAVFQHESKGTSGENGSFALMCTNMWMFVRMWKQFIHTKTEAYECSCKWRGEARARMCKCSIKQRILIRISMKKCLLLHRVKMAQFEWICLLFARCGIYSPAFYALMWLRLMVQHKSVLEQFTTIIPKPDFCPKRSLPESLYSLAIPVEWFTILVHTRMSTYLLSCSEMAKRSLYRR